MTIETHHVHFGLIVVVELFGVFEVNKERRLIRRSDENVAWTNVTVDPSISGKVNMLQAYGND